MKNYAQRGLHYLRKHTWLAVYFVILLLILPITVLLVQQQQNSSSYADTVPLSIDVQKSVNQSTASNKVTSPSFTTQVGGELVVVFLASDGSATAPQSFISVTGGGLQFTLAKRANGQKGTSEVWYAFAPQKLNRVQITATRQYGSYRGIMRVVTFKGASTVVGALAGSSAPTGAPSVSLITTAANSLILGVGNDPTQAVKRTISAGQQITQQYVVSGIKHTFWTQQYSSAIPLPGTMVMFNVSQPTADAWNLVAVEIIPLPVTPTPTVTLTPTANPTEPVSTGTPSPTVITPTTQPVGGKPGSTNTGVPAGTVLTDATVNADGYLISTQNGQVIDRKEINGCVKVRHANVTITRSRITCSDYFPIEIQSGNLIIEDSEIIGTSAGVTAGISFGDYVARRINVHGGKDGLKAQDNVVIEDSWIHDLWLGPDDHADGVQQDGGGSNITLRRNNIDIVNNGTGHGGAPNAAVQVDKGAASNFIIEGNWFNGGGEDIVNFRAGGGTGNQIINNRFGRNYGGYTTGKPPIYTEGSVTVSGNVWDDTGELVN